MAVRGQGPRKSLHVGDVPLPELAPNEVYIAIMASSINFNTVWTSIFEPLPTFGFLDRLGTESVWARAPRPGLPRRRLRLVGRRAAGRLRRCATGSRVTASSCTATHVDHQDPSAHDDSMLAANQRIWGFETNYGGLADLARRRRPTS